MTENENALEIYDLIRSEWEIAARRDGIDLPRFAPAKYLTLEGAKEFVAAVLGTGTAVLSARRDDRALRSVLHMEVVDGKITDVTNLL